jgi:hypothetical protein
MMVVESLNASKLCEYWRAQRALNGRDEKLGRTAAAYLISLAKAETWPRLNKLSHDELKRRGWDQLTCFRPQPTGGAA